MSEYCYFERGIGADATQLAIHLVRDGTLYKTSLPGAAEARTRCTWWREGAT